MPAFAQTDPLAAGFAHPPESARPRVWWHWMNGNVTARGIRRDLDWMHRIGIGGVNIIDASIATPQVVKHRLIYMAPDWKAAFRDATARAHRYGMEVSIDSSPGWSETGGPWVAPEAAMKKLVWSRTEIAGGRPFHGVLPRPPDVPGPFQNVPLADTHAPRFYRDSIVIAYRMPVTEPAAARAASNAGAVDAVALTDGDLTDGAVLTPKDDGDVWIAFDYGRPVRMQGLTLAVSITDGLGYAASIEASDDGTAWRHVADLPPAAQIRRFVLRQQTISFAPTTARFFRVVLAPAPPIPTSLRIVSNSPGADMPPPKPAGPRAYHVYELAFRAAATVNAFEKKAGFAIARDNYAIASTAPAAPGTAVDPANVVALSDRMAPDGTLDWTPPPGRWTVLRMGYSLTGGENHPATAEATGLEVDKLDRAAVRDYMAHYLALYKGLGIDALTVDSAEVGAQNWTANILADFRRLNGYDPTPWLPTLVGQVVKSPVDSDRFLWDFRRTLNRLLAENHYGTIAEVARAHGLVNYGEALEDHRPTFGDDTAMRRYTTVPMGAMWTYGARREPLPTYVADLQGAASVAHVYGQNLVAAESFTSAWQPWAYAPRDLKPVVDMEFALGVNRVVIHTSPHQPVDRAPGLSLSIYGQFFDRLESWAKEAGPWIKYISRCSWLLQQGRYAADVAYFYGEEAPVTGLFGDKAVDVPEGYGFDFVDADGLEHRLAVTDGALVTPSGTRYRVLYLGGTSRMMTLAVLKRIRDLAAAGAVVVGKKPVASPSLADDPADFQKIADDLFGGTAVAHAYGKGTVFASGSLTEAFATLHLAPDFAYTKPEADTEIRYLHRRLDDGDLYFLTNRLDRPETVIARFRVSGYAPEIWNAVTGAVAPAGFTVADGRTDVPLTLAPYGSAFVVFRKKTEAVARNIAAPASTVLETLRGPWTVAFQPGRGAPARIALRKLQSWSDSKIPGVKYFSGTGTYTTTFALPQGALEPGARLVLDLGEVRELAEVSLNGKRVGAVWTPPFALDITKAAQPGANRLSVRVTNLWVNRLIGDAQPGARRKFTFTTIPTYRADAPLLPSGLLGSVVIRRLAATHQNRDAKTLQ